MNKVLFILLIVIISACVDGNQPTNQKMRRFTFAAFNELEDAALFQQISADQQVQVALQNSGVINFNYCTIDSISFLVVDMDESFDLSKTRKSIVNLSDDYPELKQLEEIINGKYKALNRIYKLEQKEQYNTEDGQLIPMQTDAYARFVLTLEIVNDPALAKEYVAVHSIGKAWPEITQNMKTVGIYEMELYLMDYRAFLIMDTKPDFDWETDGKKWGELPRESEWQAYVAKFQKTDPESKAAEKWKTMNVIPLNNE